MSNRKCMGTDGYGFMYEIEETDKGWSVLKQGRHKVTFSLRVSAVAMANYLCSQGRERVTQ